MTPADMAALHRLSFAPASAWSEDAFENTLAQPHVQAITSAHGFALTRTLAGETELLTIAVNPHRRREGIAKELLTQWLKSSRPVAEYAFLEVASDNLAARALYERLGFAQTGLRKGYYPREFADAADALILSLDLTQG